MNAAKLQQAAAKALQVAGEWLAVQMRDQVGHQWRKGPGSPAGTPPYRRTGYAQSTIGVEYTDTGCKVGVTQMDSVPGRKTQPDLSGMMGRNYLAGHDTGTGVVGGIQRPWLSLWVTRYKQELDAMVRRFLDIQLRKS